MNKAIEDQIACILKNRPQTMRIAQFISNATYGRDFYYTSDEKFLQRLKEYARECHDARERLTKENSDG